MGMRCVQQGCVAHWGRRGGAARACRWRIQVKPPRTPLNSRAKLIAAHVTSEVASFGAIFHTHMMPAIFHTHMMPVIFHTHMMPAVFHTLMMPATIQSPRSATCIGPPLTLNAPRPPDATALDAGIRCHPMCVPSGYPLELHSSSFPLSAHIHATARPLVHIIRNAP